MSIQKRGSFDLDKSLQLFRNKKRTLPRQLGNKALNFFIQSFRKGGFTDLTFKKWKPRFARISRTRISKRFKEPANLIKSSKLFRSMQIISASFKKISVGTRGVPYAVRHNIGETDKLGRKMPKRQFMGNSRKLDGIIEKKIRAEIDKVFK